MCFALYAAARRVVRGYRPLLDALELTYPQYLVLLVLWGWAHEGVERPTLRALGERLDLDSGTLTPLLRRLEDKGLSRASAQSDDERELFVQLTPAGHRFKQRAREVPLALLEQLPDSRSTNCSSCATSSSGCARRSPHDPRRRRDLDALMRRQSTPLFVAPALAAVFLPGAVASAHISLEQGGTHVSRYGDGEIKDAPCGRANGQRGTNVYTYRPGETIKVSIVEFIPHPGYFRIAFDDDGDDDFEIPAGTDGEFGNCAGDPKCGPGMADYCNNDTVLLDYLDPHASSGLGNAPTYTFSVTLPNVECDNCTLQIIQMMNDLNVHFQPYPADDIYYTCIDLVLSNDADEVTDAPVTNDGMDCKAGEPQGGAGGGGGAAARAAGGAGSGGAAAGGRCGRSRRGRRRRRRRGRCRNGRQCDTRSRQRRGSRRRRFVGDSGSGHGGRDRRCWRCRDGPPDERRCEFGTRAAAAWRDPYARRASRLHSHSCSWAPH